MAKKQPDWERWETVVRKILYNLREHLGYSRVEGKTKLPTKSGRRRYEIDCIAYRERSDGSDETIIVECRRRGKRVDQGAMGEFAYRIGKTADGGLMVSCTGFQRGARDVADEERIGTAVLNLNATETDYELKIAKELFKGVSGTDSAAFTDAATLAADVA